MTIDKQTAKLGARILENLPVDLDDNTMQGWIDNPKGLQKFLRGLCPSPVVVPTLEPPLDFIIHVDRSVKPSYPEWMKKVMHLELEGTGPSEYNLKAQVEEWLHDDQKSGVVRGQMIYGHLKASNELANCLGLADLLAIQAKGIAVFRKLFKGKAVFGWKSIVENRDINDNLNVPYLCGLGGGVLLHWHWLNDDWYSGDPALRFRK